MKLSPKVRKWGRRLLILLLVRMVISGVLYLIIVYRFENIVNFIVKKETKGAYNFEAGKANINLWKRNLVFREASLVCKDTIHAKAHYDIRISEINLSIESWKELIFHKRVTVENLHIGNPTVYTHQHESHRTGNVNIHTSTLLKSLHKTLDHLQVRSFSLTGGSFKYKNIHQPSDFYSNNINLIIKNFLRSKKQHLMYSDDLVLSLKDQHWTLPSGKKDIKFSRLHFSSATQIIELDSFKLHSSETEHSIIQLTADKLYINAKHLAELFDQERLIVDSLIIINPTLQVQTRHNGKNKASSHKHLETLLKGMQAKYVDIRDGQLKIYEPQEANPTYSSEKISMKVFNLAYNTTLKDISTDSVQLSLNKFFLLSPDSLFKMEVASFSMVKRDLFFRNVSYVPTKKNPEKEALIFKTPLIHIKNVSIESLLHKQLTGSEANVFQPAFLLISRNNHHVNRNKKIDAHFFQALNNIGHLISVEHFNIIDGRFDQSSKHSIQLRNIDASILLKEFLSSGSLFRIKKSIPTLSIGNFKITSPGLSLNIRDYLLKGTSKDNYIKHLDAQTGSGINITASNVYWHSFDWDLLVSSKKIHANRLSIKNMQFKKGGNIQFDASNIQLSNIRNIQKVFYWDSAAATLSNLSYIKNGLSANVGELILSNTGILKFHSIAINKEDNKGKFSVTVPQASASSFIGSTLFNRLSIKDLHLSQPSIYVQRQLNSDKPALAAGSKLPIDLSLTNGEINNGSFHYVSIKDYDTISITATANALIENIISLKDSQSYRAGKVSWSIKKMSIAKKNIHLALENTSWNLEEGKLHTGNYSIFVSGNLSGAFSGLRFNTMLKDSSRVELQEFNGKFSDDRFVVNTTNRYSWKTLPDNITVSGGNLFYYGKTMSAQANMVSWKPTNKTLSLGSFALLPNASMDQFISASEFQKDYITAEGKELDLIGITPDSILSIRKIQANEVSISTTRDKRKPFYHSEKQMPGQLITKAKHLLRIDSIQVSNSNITIREISSNSNRMGIIPVRQVEAMITGISNDGTSDSMKVAASGKIHGNNISRFFYIESYKDSLAGFNAGISANSMSLPTFSSITVPLASINIAAGRSDTLFASWSGNKYAAYGNMNFFYRKLRIKVLDKHNPDKKSFLLNVESALANTFVLHSSNRKHSTIYFLRDREKFIFNYWIKTILHGMMSSTGIKKNKKIIREYKKSKEKYGLPG